MIPGAENPDVFPASVAGYAKTSVVAYAPGMTDYSVGYNDTTPGAPDFATLYLYQGSAPLAAQNAEEQQAILRGHPGGRILDEATTTLVKGGRSYPARVTTLTFQDTIGGRSGTWYSRLVLVALPGYWFKLRATTPVEAAASLETRTQSLLDAVDWASPRAAPGIRPRRATPSNAT